MSYTLERYPFNYTKHQLLLQAYKEHCRKDGDYYDYEYLIYLIPHCERRSSKRGIVKVTGKDYEVINRAISWFNNITKEDK